MYRERGSHSRGGHPTQDTPRMSTARVKQEEETDTRIRQESNMKYERKNRGLYKEKSPK